MADILLPILDPDDSQWAVEQAISLNRRNPVKVHLLSVRHPLPRHIAQFFGGGDLRRFHEETGMRALEPAIRLLDQAGVAHEEHVVVGRQAQSIVEFAKQHECVQIILPQRKGFPSLGLGSIGSQVRQLMQAPTA
jgi:nucleotide-binding universal stress UspA family protein